MRIFSIIVMLYALCLAQIGFAPFFPDLLLLSLFVVSLHENRLSSTLLGFLSGLCLDLSSPAYLGCNTLLYAGCAYGASSLHSLIYRGRWHMLVLAAIGLTLKYVLFFLCGVGLPPVGALLVSSGITLLLAAPADRLLSHLLYAKWQTG